MMTFCFTYSIIWKTFNDLADQVFSVLANIANLFILVQLTFLWQYREKIAEIFGVIKDFYKPREEGWVQELAQPLFENGSAFLYKLCK